MARDAATGAVWLTGQKWIVRLTGLVTIAILTRLIPPEGFGVVAAAATVTPFILLLADLGLSVYVVQAERLDDRILSTGFWFSMLAGAGLALALVAVAPLIAGAFDLPGSTPVFQAMALAVFLAVVGSLPMGLLRREMRFQALAIQTAKAATVGQSVAIVLALAGAGVWALVVQLTVANLIASGLAWRAAHWRPMRVFSRSDFSVMARFGTKVVSVELIAAARATGEAAIIANVLGAAALGYLNIAQRLVQITTDLSASALAPVSTVVFAKVRASRERLRAAYLRALAIGYAAVSPMLVFTAVGAPLLIPLLFGERWESSVPVAQALALAATLTLGATIDYGLFNGVGRPGRWLAYAAVIDGLTLATTAILAPSGLVAVAWGFVGVALLATAVRWLLVGRLLDMAAVPAMGVFARAMAAVTATCVVGAGLRVMSDGLAPVVSLGLIALGVLTTQIAMLRWLSPGVLSDMREMLPIPARIASLVRR